MENLTQDIRPISELRQYTTLLEDVQPNHPVILTKNGYGKYALVDLADFERIAKLALKQELIQMYEQLQKEDITPLDEVKRMFDQP